MNLSDKLNAFSKQFKHCSLQTKTYDITDAFRTMPKNFGKPEIILGYIVEGHTFSEKYKLQDNKPARIKFQIEQEIIATLCMGPLKNTTLHEVKSFIDIYKQPVQEWNAKTVINVTEKIKEEEETFSSKQDSLFIFAGNMFPTYTAIELHQLWFDDIISKGSKVLEYMSNYEASLIEDLFHKGVLMGDKESILRNSYQYGTPNYLPLSTEFLKRKIDLYNEG